MSLQPIDVAPDLWVWRVAYPDWRPEAGWERVVSSTCVTTGGEVALIDPIAPPQEATDVWERLDARPPTMVVILTEARTFGSAHTSERLMTPAATTVSGISRTTASQRRCHTGSSFVSVCQTNVP